jgi:regulatory protein
MEETFFRVTAIERQKRNPARVSVFLDGVFAFGMDEEVLFRNPIHEGDSLPESFVDGVLLADERVRAKAGALRFLSHRPMTTDEVRRKLLDREFSERTAERVIADLSRVGLLDDRAFASSFVRTRLIQRPCSKRMLIMELKHKGIGEAAAAEAVDEAYGPESEEAVAGELFRAKMASLKGEDARKARKKAVDFLFRRGFDWELIRSAMDAEEEEAISDRRSATDD